MGRKWLRPDDVTFRPKELLELEAGLRALHFAAYPALPTSPAAISSTSSPATAEQEANRVLAGSRPRVPDPAREPYRRALRRILRAVDRLADQAHDAARGETNPRYAKRCESCGSGLRWASRFCDKCGRPVAA